MKLEEYLATVREIAKLSMEGKSDEEIAKKIGLPVLKVTRTRRFIGLVHREHKNIFSDDRKKAILNSNGSYMISFNIPRIHLEDLGLSPKTRYAFTGKILGKKRIELRLFPA